MYFTKLIFESLEVVVLLLPSLRWILVSMVVILFTLRYSGRKNAQLDLPGPRYNRLLFPIFLALRAMKRGMRNTAELLLQVLCAYSNLFAKYGMFTATIANRRVVVLHSAETAEIILNSNEHLQKGFEYNFVSEWLREGLLTSKKEKWKHRRKLLTSSFHFRILDEFAPIFNEQAAVFAKQIQKEMTAKQSVDITELASLCTLDILCETAMGKAIHAQEDKSSPYVQAVHEACRCIVDRLMNVWLWPDFIYQHTKKGKFFKEQLQIMDQFTRLVINERKSEKLKEKSTNKCSENEDRDFTVGKSRQRLALLDMLLDIHFKDASFTLQDVSEEVHTFMFAGHDTTSASLSFALYMLGLYPDIQRKVQLEVEEVLGDDICSPVPVEKLKELKYLDCVLKETRRLFPPVLYITRELAENTVISGYTLPKGTNCAIFIYMIHRDPKVYPNPEVFDPDRFTHENTTGRHPFAYIPFSAGPRNCIGQRFAAMQLLILVATVVRQYNIKSTLPRDQLHLVPEIVLRCMDGLHLQFTPR